ncbi:hypothetical protein NEHOM01_2478 [Nematocida homosporus]|uniref:uncharacterized protein n=1 Tax=Nematocida homosporus TaxID=1912981 RepID=UPI00221FC330|nr:uncharacterized protein NEHOM01_2478 [Nematocida homosporus]KAI5187989.1 hypothetical protein NEHOM01_2478 [Nematocida homosporus]
MAGRHAKRLEMALGVLSVVLFFLLFLRVVSIASKSARPDPGCLFYVGGREGLGLGSSGVSSDTLYGGRRPVTKGLSVGDGEELGLARGLKPSSRLRDRPESPVESPLTQPNPSQPKPSICTSISTPISTPTSTAKTKPNPTQPNSILNP